MKTQLKATVMYAAIREINRAAIMENGFKEFFQRSCQAIRKAIPCDRVAFSLYSPEQRGLILTAEDGQGINSFYQAGLILDCRESHHGWVFQHQKVLIRRHLQRECEFQIERPNVEEGIQSYCAVPLTARTESLGVFIVLSTDRGRYSATDAEFLQEISDQFVMALKYVMPTCSNHFPTRLICPRCIASYGGRMTAARHKAQLSKWGKLGGRGRKKIINGLSEDVVK
jgi:formate hydrogenlyase transcriptional activator